MIEYRKTAVTYQGDGNTSVFPFSFAVTDANSVHVSIYDKATDVSVELTRDYFVDMTANVVHYPGYAPGESVDAHAQPPKLPRGKNITIYRVTPIDQLTDLGNKYPLPYIETMADKLTAILQEHDEMFGRTVTLPAGDPKTPEQRLTDLQAYVLDAKNAASAADQSARSAGDSKAFAASSASSAAQSAAASEASRQASAESENKIKNMQVDVHAIQQHVDEVKTAIDGVAARAKADGQTVSNAAVQSQRSAGASAQSAAASEASAVRAEAATKYEGIVKSENLEEKSVHKKHLHQDAYESPALTGTPIAPTAGRGTNNGQIASTAFVAQAIAALVNSAPGTLDTLQKLAAALGNDANFAATITNALAGKVSKSGDTITGKIVFSNSNEVKKSIFPSHYYHNVFADNNPRTFVHAYSEVNPPQYQTSYEIRISEGDGRFKAFIFSNDGLHTDLKGNADTASNAAKLGGQSLAWIVDQINTAKTGIVAGNLAPNGWVKLANGLIVQWGMGSEQLSEATQTVIFPITFSRGCFSLITGTILSVAGIRNDSMWQVATVERESAVLFHQHFTTDGIGKTKPTYIAIGV